MGASSSSNHHPSTPAGTYGHATPLARSAMRPSSFTPSSATAGHATPQAHAKAALPSHLSRSTGPPSSPLTPNGNLDTPSSSSSVRFEDRQNALEVAETLNGHLPSIVGSATESSTSRIALVSNANPKDYVYRYMFEKVTERAAGKRLYITI